MSDEHNPKFLGAAGHPFIATPNLDALAARGTRFTAAYTTCPICVPARAAFAVGRYVHDIGYWDNADGYDGAIPSWHHALRDAGHRVVSIGKLHFRGRPGDDHGFSEEIVPMHIVDGIGDVKGLVRENIPKRKGGDKMAQARRPRRVVVHGLRPRHRGARADLAARGSAEVARPTVGAVRVVRRAALSAHRAAAVVLPLLAAGPADAQAVRARRAPASSVSRHVRAHGRLRHTLRVRGRRQARDRRLRRPRVGDGRERRRRAARAARRGTSAGHARDLHERPRRQRRRARPVGQVHAVRGKRRRAADRGRPRRSGRPRRRHAGVAHRLRADDPRGGRRCRRASAAARCPARRCSRSRTARSRSGP